MFYGMMSISTTYNNVVDTTRIEEEYNYHMELDDLNEVQYDSLVNYFGSKIDKNNKLYTIVDHTDYTDQEGDQRYDVKLLFKNDSNDTIQQAYERFNNNYVENLKALSDNTSGLDSSTTALFNISQYKTNNTSTFWLITVILLLVSILLLTVLYRIRINQYKFIYGV